MRQLLFLLLLSACGIFSSAGCGSDSGEEKPFRLSIQRTTTSMPPTSFEITRDSIAVVYTDSATQQIRTYVQHLTALQQKELSAIVDAFASTPAHLQTTANFDIDWQFAVYLKRGTAEYRTSIAHYKINDLYDITKLVDSWLPQQYRTGYDEKYFGQ